MSEPALTDTPKPARWYTVDEVVALFDGYISDEMFYRLVRDGRLPGVRFDRKILVLRSPIDLLIEKVKDGAFVDIATLITQNCAAPTPDFAPTSGPRADGEGVA